MDELQKESDHDRTCIARVLDTSGLESNYKGKILDHPCIVFRGHSTLTQVIFIDLC